MAWPRRLSSLALGWRAGLASAFAARADHLADGEADAPEAAPAPDVVQIQQGDPPLTVDDARLLRALEAERLAIARKRGVAPRAIASEQALRALARERPARLDDPLFSGIEDATALLRVIRDAR